MEYLLKKPQNLEALVLGSLDFRKAKVNKCLLVRISLLRGCSWSDDDSKDLPSSWVALGAADKQDITMVLLLSYKTSLGWTCIGITRRQGNVSIL